MKITTEYVNEFEAILKEITQFSMSWIRGEITSIEGPTRTSEVGPGAIMTEINPVEYPNILISLIESEGRIVGTRISHVDYVVPVVEVPPPTAMLAQDA
tara:strand:+ start:7068 stop:7364 length:297 start_codon:yes stop_codon:yes gene_type:complete